MTNNISRAAKVIHQDSPSDSSNPDSEILSVSVDNTISLIIFTINLNNSWNFTPFNRIYTFISVNNETGTNNSMYVDILYDYIIGLIPKLDNLSVNLADEANSSNNLNDGQNKSNMAFANLYNDNKTAEFGWRLKQYHEGIGFLNLSFGQTIYIKFYAGKESDLAPNIGLEPIKFILEDKRITTTTPAIPSFEFLVVFFPLIFLLGIYYIQKRYKIL
ncbi:MAG: hypothetical protein EU547_05145 [Promethearchaeota archaeon]|nr:MAG: hypothetical protein EU547_05145 [Candidatus Lokiarchaeota archaeon]